MKSGNTDFLNYDNVNDVIDEFLELLISRYQIGLETLVRGSNFIFDSVQLLYYKCHKVIVKCGELYIKYHDWIKNKKPTINPKNDNDKCFQYETAVALNHEEMKGDPQRISKTKPFRNKYNWDGIKYPSNKWKRFRKIIQQLLLMFYTLKKWKYVPLIFQI